MPPSISAYLSVFNDWEFLAPALKSIAERIDELVVVDGAYRWMVTLLQAQGLDVERSDQRVLDAVIAAGIPVKLITGVWENEFEKRMAGYRACAHRYIMRIDADEILFFDDARLSAFLASGAAVACMEMPGYVVPGWVAVGPPASPVPDQCFLFDRQQIGPDAHLNYIWLFRHGEELPAADQPKLAKFPAPIAFNAHMTGWRTPATSMTRGAFYRTNYMRRLGVPWLAGAGDTPVTDFAAFFSRVDPIAFHDSLAVSRIVVAPYIAPELKLRPTPLPPRVDRRLAAYHDRFLTSLADLNVEITQRDRHFIVHEEVVIDLSTPAATDACSFLERIRLRFEAPIDGVVAKLRFLVTEAPWECIVELATAIDGPDLSIDLSRVDGGPVDYVRRVLELIVWTESSAPIQRFRILRETVTAGCPVVLSAEQIDEAPMQIPPATASAAGTRLLARPTLAALRAWFTRIGADADLAFVEEHFDRLSTLCQFALNRASLGIDRPLDILAIGAFAIAVAPLLTNDEHHVTCADSSARCARRSAEAVATACGSRMVSFETLADDDAQAQTERDAMDLVLFFDELPPLVPAAAASWHTLYRTLKPGGRIVLTVPNATDASLVRCRVEAVIAGVDMPALPPQAWSLTALIDGFHRFSSEFVVTQWRAWGGEAQMGHDVATDAVLREVAERGNPTGGQFLFVELTLKSKRTEITPNA